MRISDWSSDVCSSDLRHSGAGLVERIRAIVESEGGELLAKISGEPFLTPPGEFSDMIAAAITQATGLEPELSTSGGTSDARFLSRLCPVVEFGLCNADRKSTRLNSSH